MSLPLHIHFTYTRLLVPGKGLYILKSSSGLSSQLISSQALYFALLSLCRTHTSESSSAPEAARPRTEAMASRRRDLGRPMLVALCVVALFAVGSESHGLEDFGEGKTEATPEMASFFGAKPEAAVLPEALDNPQPAKPEAASAMPTTMTGTSSSSGPPRRSVSVAAGVSCAIAALAVVGVAVAVAFVVRSRRETGARREPAEVHLGAP